MPKESAPIYSKTTKHNKHLLYLWLAIILTLIIGATAYKIILIVFTQKQIVSTEAQFENTSVKEFSVDGDANNLYKVAQREGVVASILVQLYPDGSATALPFGWNKDTTCWQPKDPSFDNTSKAINFIVERMDDGGFTLSYVEWSDEVNGYISIVQTSESLIPESNTTQNLRTAHATSRIVPSLAVLPPLTYSYVEELRQKQNSLGVFSVLMGWQEDGEYAFLTPVFLDIDRGGWIEVGGTSKLSLSSAINVSGLVPVVLSVSPNLSLDVTKVEWNKDTTCWVPIKTG